MFIDFHTHKPIHKGNAEVLEVVSAHKQIKYEGNYYTIGHHPWWSDAVLSESDLQNLAINLENSLCLGIGECGLDKLKGASKSIQEEVFFQQIQLANAHKVPVIIHCVRQYDQIIHFRKQHGQTPWAIHGFRRNLQLAKSLLGAGIKLSVSPFLNMNQSFTDMLRYLPLDQFFIETDSEYSLSIQQRYQIMADLKGISNNQLQEVLETNFKHFFKSKFPI